MDEHYSRFWRGVDVGGPDECWPWMGQKFRFGHGRFRVKRGGVEKAYTASSVAFYFAYRQWADTCRHACDNPACCNPAHLREGTQKDNVQDAITRRRMPQAQPKLTQEQADAIRAGSAAGRTGRALAEEFGVSPATVSWVVNRKGTYKKEEEV